MRRSQNSRPLVLVVDDDPRHGQLLNLLEENLAIKVFNVHSCEEALSAVKENSFDLILMDYSMPERDGVDCTKCLKEIFATSEILPIIAVTGHASDEVKRICLDSGMDDFLTKPFTINALQAMIDKHLALNADN
ncbi:MAG: response regulator [Candidatus Obscuribacterales bacterium]|nr:response regulator [Candidatus Obscuribacterales bacterium]